MKDDETLFLETLHVKHGEVKDPNWYILHYNNLNCFRTLLALLKENFKFESWQPSFAKKVWKNRKWVSTRRLVFPGYAFLRTDDISSMKIAVEDKFKEYYVYFLMKSCNKVASLTEEEVKWLRELEVILEELHKEYVGFLPNDIVCLKDLRMGYFKGRVLEVNSDSNKVLVEFIVFSRPTCSWVDIDLLDLVERQGNDILDEINLMEERG